MTLATDSELAAELGTDRKSIRRWRERFPQDVPATRDVEPWRKFMKDNLLGPYSARMQYGEALESETPPPRGEKNGSGPWNRMQSLFPVMQVMQRAYENGEISPQNYLYLGAATLAHVKAISEIWGTDIAPDGWDAIWEHIAGEVEKKITGL